MPKKKKGQKATAEPKTARTAKVLSGVSAIALLAAGAVLTPLGQKVTQRVWPDDPALVHDAAWMEDLQCEQDPNIAGLPGTKEITEFTPGGDEELRRAAITDLGAVGWYRGNLSVTLTTKTNDPVYIVGIDLVIHEQKELTPAWGLEFKEPCGGGASYRLFDVLLDHDVIKDRGVVEQGVEAEELGTVDRPPAEKIGRTFTVARNDPAELDFDVYACTGYYEWGVEISYITGDEKKSVVLGPKEDPYRMVGGYQNVRRYHGDFEGTGPVIAKGPQPAADKSQPSEVPVSARDACT